MVWPTDNFQRGTRRRAHLVDTAPCVATVGPNQSKSRELVYGKGNRSGRGFSVMDGRRVDVDRQRHPQRVDDQVPLAPLQLLAAVVAAKAPFSLVFTVWLSMIPAVGTAALPDCLRHKA